MHVTFAVDLDPRSAAALSSLPLEHPRVDPLSDPF
jgi:hypothetical protein